MDLVNIYNELLPSFILSTEKNKTWTEWLEEELHYINGKFYLNSTPPTLQSQKFKEINFQNNSTLQVACNFMINGTNFITTQKNNTVVMINGTVVNPSSINILSSKGLQIILETSRVNGDVKIIVPSYSSSSNVYTGVVREFKARSQTITFDLTNTNWTNDVVVSVVVTNPVENQRIIGRTLDRNGAIVKSYPENLASNGLKTFTMEKTSTVKGFEVVLNAIKKNDLYYTGCQTEKLLWG